MSDFLLELRSEEIPARMQARARDDLARLIAAELAKAGIVATDTITYATPRRLALIARGLPDTTPATREETKGPKTSAPAQAFDGFLRKNGLARDQLVERDGVFVAVVERPGRATIDVLADAIPAVIRSFPWPKSMRWGAASASTESLRWVRPLHGIVALLGSDIVPCGIAGIVAGAATLGHRFHHPGPITIGSADDYAAKLRACHVMIDPAEREALIRERAAALAAQAGLALIPDEGLVAENAGLTEWPVPLLGRFDAGFLGVPPEVIQLTARVNQKYFVCRSPDGALADAFVCTANIDAIDGGAAIVEGNRKVLAARLADARFFYETDLKVPLDEQAKKLDRIVFHEKLGTMADKVERVAKLAEWLASEGIVPGCDPALARRAAELCKADLVTGMVGEFPELQGVMGGYYAAAQGEDPQVAAAIRDHYKPVGQGDEVPTAPVTVAVSLADKLDTLVGFYAVGLKPSGSRDPFALRRAALGIIRLLIANKVRVGLAMIVRQARTALLVTLGRQHALVPVAADPPNGLYRAVTANDLVSLMPDVHILPVDAGTSGATLTQAQVDEAGTDVWKVAGLVRTIGDLLTYMGDRIAEAERARGIRIDLIRSVIPQNVVEFTFWRPGKKAGAEPVPVHLDVRLDNFGMEDDLVRVLARVEALQALMATQAGTDLLAGYKRAANILKKEGGSPSPTTPQPPAPATLLLSTEGKGVPLAQSALVAALNAAAPSAAGAIAREDFAGAMVALASLRAPIDRFFDEVTVNDPDPAIRAERLALLACVRDAVHTVADFSRIEG